MSANSTQNLFFLANYSWSFFFLSDFFSFLQNMFPKHLFLLDVLLVSLIFSYVFVLKSYPIHFCRLFLKYTSFSLTITPKNLGFSYLLCYLMPFRKSFKLFTWYLDILDNIDWCLQKGYQQSVSQENKNMQGYCRKVKEKLNCNLEMRKTKREFFIWIGR